MKTQNRAFTLIELLVVIAIIGILTAVGLGNYKSSQIKARDAKRKSDLSQIQKGLEMYYNDKGKYPTSSAGKIEGCDGGVCNWGNPWEKDEVVYIKTMPYDPRGKYCYQSSDGTDYQLYARLENERDPDLGGPYTCTGEEYNYGVSSANVIP